VDDVVARYRAASEANDIDALLELLEPDAELISPLSRRMVFRGANGVRALLAGL
jgi:ketosteroid isomerase-like protein